MFPARNIRSAGGCTLDDVKTDLPILVTAANAPFARCIYQLLRSAERHGWSARFHWIVYDMGFTPQDRARLKRRFPWCEWRVLQFEGLPDHLPPERGSYAWKPLVIARVAEEFRCRVLWLDSAALVVGDPAPIFQALGLHGLWVLRGQSSLRIRCEPAVLTALGVPGRLWDRREVFAGSVAFDAARPWVLTLVQRWRDLSLDRANVLPVPRTIERHMHDQAVLSALVIPELYGRLCPYPVWDVDISSPRPIRYLTSRNKLPGWVPWLADPVVRAWYRVAKALDQAGLRLERWWRGIRH